MNPQTNMHLLFELIITHGIKPFTNNYRSNQYTYRSNNKLCYNSNRHMYIGSQKNNLYLHTEIDIDGNVNGEYVDYAMEWWIYDKKNRTTYCKDEIRNLLIRDYDSIFKFALVFKSRIVFEAVQSVLNGYRKYKFGDKLNCKNNCGNIIEINIMEVRKELPVCCACTNPNKKCVNCTNHPTILRCVCGKYFHKLPGKYGNHLHCNYLCKG